MSRTSSPAGFVVALSVLVGLTGSSVNTAPMPPLDNAAAGVVCDPSTGHCYEYVAGPLNWNAAKAAAEAKTHNGVSGHLATMTSQAEINFIVATLPDAVAFRGVFDGGAYIGAYQLPGSVEPGGGWQWVTGEPWVYSNWTPGEPNNSGGEDVAHFWTTAGAWNDAASHLAKGFLVEYSAPALIDFDAPHRVPWGIGQISFGHISRKTGPLDVLSSDDGGPNSSRVWIYTNGGNGNMTLATTLQVPLGGFDVQQSVLADLNDDGYDDVIAGGGRGFCTYLNNRSGGFSTTPTACYFSGTTANTYFPANFGVGKLDAARTSPGGPVDLILAAVGRILVLTGNGDGTFAPAGQLLNTGHNYPTPLIKFADVDGTGYPAIVATGVWGNPLKVFRNDRNGTYTESFNLAAPHQNYFQPGMQFIDMDDDEILDAVVATGEPSPTGWKGKIYWHKGEGNASFSQTKNVAFTEHTASRLHLNVPEWRDDWFYASLASGDVDGDGLVDLFASAGQVGQPAVLRNNGDGTFTEVWLSSRTDVDGKHAFANMLYYVDMNGTGEKVLVGANTRNNAWQQQTPYGFYWGPNSVAPERAACDPGSYLSGVTCILAPAGSYSAGGTATSPTPCPAGTYSSDAGATACTPAPAGSFVSTTGATSATACTAGSYSDTEGSLDCTLAPAGSYAPTPGATSATACTVGYYSNTAGATLCTPAPAGSYVPATGATSSTLCPAGTYSDIAGASACTPAPAGSYVPNAGATSATACPTHYSSEAGATSCFPLDTDNDGVLDKDDAYINSNLSATVSVGACNAGVQNKVLPSGASFNDLLASAVSGAANHGATVSAVTSLTNGWKAAGLISGRDHGAIVSCVAKSK